MMITDLYDQFLQNPKICTDTRKITLGCLFFALKGPHFNGNEFAKEALNKGASYAIVDDEFLFLMYGTVCAPHLFPINSESH